MRWEYCVSDLTKIINNPGQIEKFLNDYGMKAWELVAVFGNFYHLKRLAHY